MRYKGFEIASAARRTQTAGAWVASYAIYEWGAEVHVEQVDRQFDSFDAAIRAADASARKRIDADITANR